MSRPTFRRTEHPNPAREPGGTAYDVLVDGELVGQVWQVSSGTYVWKDGAHRFKGEVAWTWTGARGGAQVATRADAAAELPWPGDD